MLSQIQSMVTKLKDTQGKLHGTWADRKAKLDEMYEQQMFFRDANQLDTLSNTQEVRELPLATNLKIQ